MWGLQLTSQGAGMHRCDAAVLPAAGRTLA